MRRILILSLLVGIVLGLIALSSGSVHADPVGISYTAVNSCAQCHGDDYDANKPTEKKRKEVDIWTKNDPHSKTYNQLLEEPAKNIGAKMKIADVSNNAYCISCHALSGLSTTGGIKRVNLDVKTVKMDEGVSCNTCHGPSGVDKKKGYLFPHKEEGWTQKKRTEIGAQKLFDDFGLYDTKNMLFRANLCYSCHMIIDPELIEAGHPHRPYEANVLYYRYKPKSHFGGDVDPFAETKLWCVGQAISLRQTADTMNSVLQPGKKNDQGARDLVQHLVGHAVTVRQIAALTGKATDDKFDAALNTVAANPTDSAKAIDALKSISAEAEQLAERVNAMKFEKDIAEKLLAGVASEFEQAGTSGLPGANQYVFGLTSLWGNLKAGDAGKDESFAAIKKSLIPVLKKTNNELDKYTPELQAAFIATSKEVAALFAGGKSLPLPAAATLANERKNAPARTQVAHVEPPTQPEPQPKVQPKPVETPKVNEPKNTVPATADELPRDVREDYSDRPPLPEAEYGKYVFCLNCGMRWEPQRKYCGRCGQLLPHWQGVQKDEK